MSLGRAADTLGGKCGLTLSAFAVIAGCGGRAPHAQTTESRGPSRVANLLAFARLYGVVRWFHPSDAASAIDWNRFAIDGARRVIDAPDAHALQVALRDLFAPIAPTVEIMTDGERPRVVAAALRPAAVAGLDVVAWEHVGYGDTTFPDGYASKRRHRDRVVPVSGADYGALWQEVDAVPFRGAHVRLRGKLRTTNHGRGQLWLRVDRGDSNGFFGNMGAHPVTSADWTSAEIVGTVDSDATRIVFGTVMAGQGTVWYDDLELAVQANDGTWTPILVKDAGFEAGDPFGSWKPGNGKRSHTTVDGWNVTIDHERPASGASALRVEAATKVLTDELFSYAPEAGETVDVDLGSGLRARVPLALYSRDGHTLGDDPAKAREAQLATSSTTAVGYDVVGGVADVIVVWNVLEHFWPYWKVVPVDWNRELDVALADALDDRTTDDHVITLERLSAAAPDGHASVGCPGESERSYPSIAVELVENQVVVTASADKAVERGDVIVSIDGHPALAQIAADEALVSGSTQWKAYRASRRFGAGPLNSTLSLRVRRGGTELDVTVSRVAASRPDPFTHPTIERLADGVYYIDLARASMADINAIMTQLSTAPGVVFDVRGYPNGNDELLSHLLTRPDTSNSWEAIPLLIRPDHGAEPAAWDTSDTFGSNMPVLEPHIQGRVAFLTGPGAISYAESVMSIVEHYRLGEIVGEPTAGTNGNIVVIAEPTGCNTSFTGRLITKLDGSRFHLVGVKPTIPASRTIAGVTAGRDEVLEKALAYVRGR